MFEILTKDEQKKLLYLAPFISIIWEPVLDKYIEKLKYYEPILNTDIGSLKDIIKKLEKIGLIKKEKFNYMNLHPALACFLKNCLLNKANLKALMENIYADCYLEYVFPLIINMMNSSDLEESQKARYILREECRNISYIVTLSMIQNKSMDKFLDVMKCVEHEYSWASIYYQLKTIVLKEQEYEQSKSDYKKALETYIKKGDRKSQEEMYYRLGLVAQKKNEYDEVKKYNSRLKIS